MSDLIRREDAIEAIANLTCVGIEEIKAQCDRCVADDEGWLGGLRDAVIELETLPSAEPERKKGKWIDGWRTIFVCSECGNTLDFEGCNAGRGDANFCPNCGTDMRGK